MSSCKNVAAAVRKINMAAREGGGNTKQSETWCFSLSLSLCVIASGMLKLFVDGLAAC